MLAGLAQRKFEATPKVADLQGGSGLLVPQECLQVILVMKSKRMIS